MRNIAHKFSTLRTATATTAVKMSPETIQLLKDDKAPKGDPLPLARAAAIMAAKKTSDLIPYCHPLLIDAVTVDFELQADRVNINVSVTAVAKTGVEMEALTAASLAALTIYDMLKPVDDDLEILGCRLVSKKGGKSDMPSQAPGGLRAGVLVVSDSVANGTRIDSSGALVKKRLAGLGIADVTTINVPDEEDKISAALIELCDSGHRLVISTGGTGIGPRDVTVEATWDVIDVEIPGISQTLRAYGQDRTPLSMLSRGIAGLRGDSLIINMPGSTGGVTDSMNVLFPALFHSYAMLAGEGH